MIKWLLRKLFLVREIKSRKGDVHFRRYRLLDLPSFKIYLHNIILTDRDRHMHDHPYDFTSFILKGSYIETTLLDKKRFGVFDRNRKKAHECHKLEIENGPIWTLVFAGRRKREWGYRTELGWVNNDKYREIKDDLYKALDDGIRLKPEEFL